VEFSTRESQGSTAGNFRVHLFGHATDRDLDEPRVFLLYGGAYPTNLAAALDDEEICHEDGADFLGFQEALRSGVWYVMLFHRGSLLGGLPPGSSIG